MGANADAARRFTLELNEQAKAQSENGLVDFHRKVCNDAFGRIVRRTPVDTGRARGNWQMAVNTAPDGELPIKDKGGQATIARGEAALQSLPPFATVHITNNLPYILVLEQGGYPNPPKHGSRIKSTDLPKLGRGKVKRSLAKSGIKFIVKSAGGYSLQAPRGMVGVTLEEMKTAYPD